MNILVVGNGFDLAHGLKTKYMDFLHYMKNEVFNDDIKRMLVVNMWLKYFFFLEENSRFRDNKWIDFEYEIQRVLNKL